VFLDTSFVVALDNNRDAHHAKAKKLDNTLLKQKATLLLHSGILLEVGDGFARLGRREKGNELLKRFRNEEGYRIVQITDDLQGRAEQFYRDHKDKEWGLTDCISFVLMKQEGIEQALTADVHFRQAGFKALLLESS
jgi:predicted nucleic acid-binding protein